MAVELQTPRFEIPSSPHSGVHFLSPEQQSEFDSLFELDQLVAVKKVKEYWRQVADQEFLQRFTFVHWVTLENLETMLADPDPQTEISTKPYVNTPYSNGFAGNSIGLIMKGEVTLAGNDDLQTNQWHQISKDGQKYTEWLNRLFTNAQNCVSPYEFVLNNWSIEAVTIDRDSIVNQNEVITLAEKFGLKVVDTDGREIST